jgi:hypothetical protein
LAGKGGCIEMGDIGNAGLTCNDILPGQWHPNPDWGNDPQSGYNNSTLRQTDSVSERNERGEQQITFDEPERNRLLVAQS